MPQVLVCLKTIVTWAGTQPWKTFSSFVEKGLNLRNVPAYGDTILQSRQPHNNSKLCKSLPHKKAVGPIPLSCSKRNKIDETTLPSAVFRDQIHLELWKTMQAVSILFIYCASLIYVSRPLLSLDTLQILEYLKPEHQFEDLSLLFKNVPSSSCF